MFRSCDVCVFAALAAMLGLARSTLFMWVTSTEKFGSHDTYREPALFGRFGIISNYQLPPIAVAMSQQTVKMEEMVVCSGIGLLVIHDAFDVRVQTGRMLHAQS